MAKPAMTVPVSLMTRRPAPPTQPSRHEKRVVDDRLARRLEDRDHIGDGHISDDSVMTISVMTTAPSSVMTASAMISDDRISDGGQ